MCNFNFTTLFYQKYKKNKHLLNWKNVYNEKLFNVIQLKQNPAKFLENSFHSLTVNYKIKQQ